MSKVKVTGTQLSFTTILTALFVFCKLAKVTAIASWSWLWVLSPVWIPLAILLGFALTCVILAAIFN